MICTLHVQVFVEGDYIFSIQLISYSNPENRLASGTCCDGSEEAGSCPAPCNTTLRMCFRNANQSRDDPGCPIQEIIGDSAPRGLNPFIQGSWPVSTVPFGRYSPTAVCDMQFFSHLPAKNETH